MSGITDLYPMTPVQAGMLFQTLMQPGRYVQQYSGQLVGPLDRAGLQTAWEVVIARHDILRAACHWQDVPQPALAIHDHVRPEWQMLDWTADPSDPARLEQWLERDRQRGFDLARPPLMRFALIRLAPERHVFVWSFHHILLDGWCGALLVREMLTIYGGGTADTAPRPFRAYVDGVMAQDHDAARMFWTDRLAGAELPTPLGHARPGPEGVAEHRRSLSPALSEQIVQTARARHLTPATLFQGVWALLLSRYGGTDDVTFGTVLSGRPADLPGAEEMIGLFLQTVPQRVQVPEDQGVWDWLAGIQSAQQMATGFGAVALSDIQSWRGADQVLFDSLLIVETYPESIEVALHRSGRNVRLNDVRVFERTGYPLTIKVLPGARFTLCLTAETAHFPAGALPRIVDDIEQVLRALLNGARCPGDIALLDDDAEAARAWALAGFDKPFPPLTPERLRSIAEQNPDAPGVEEPGAAQLTYGALMERAAQIAGGLAALGVEPGDTVALCQDRGVELVASMLGVWHLGAAYLPLDPIYPADRIAFILQDAGVALVLTDPVGQGAVPQSVPEGVSVARVEDLAGPSVPPVPLRAEDRAYVLYTSGSTGTPKGVPIPHGALANFLSSIAHTPGLRADDRMLALTTVAFDIAALEIFGPLWVGGTVIVAPAGAGMDGKALARLVETQSATVMQATPSGWRVLRDSGWTGNPSLCLLSGGEALEADLARDLLGLGRALWNLYGPTETTIWSAAMQVRHEHLNEPFVPIGGPLDRTLLSLRDPAGRRVPQGVPAELWIGGAGLGPGYLGRPDLTLERFVEDRGQRHYRTGDQMRARADGLFDVLGRLDDQVKLRGYRIEPGEIEQRLVAHPAIAQAVVVLRGTGEGARLSAYLRSDAPPDPTELRSYLAQDLPAYMIPAVWTFLDRFPLTPNGKVNRKALPDPKQTSPRAAVSQDVMAQIWANLLEVPSVTPEDDFFALGGHSLLALRLMAEIRATLGLAPDLRDIFEAPVLRDFVARIGLSPPALPPIPRSQRLMLSAAQQRQWMLWQLDPARCDYLLPLAVELTGPLDRAALMQSLMRLPERHHILRCCFPDRNGLASVNLMAEGPTPGFVDLTGADDADARLAALCKSHGAVPFDLTAVPPWRADLVALTPTRHILLITLHHILADEWSFGLLLREMTAAYVGKDPAPLPVQYSDFAAWQNLQDHSAARAFWQDALTGAPAVTELPRSAGSDTLRAGRVLFDIPGDIASALDEVARAQGVTRFMLLLAAYGVFLDKHSGQGDLIIGIPASHRRQSETQDLIGLFVNTLPIRLRPAPLSPFTALLARTRAAVLAAEAHQDLPFEEIIGTVDAPRFDRIPPLVQTLFSMPDLPGSGSITSNLHWAALPGTVRAARFDLALEIVWDEAGLRGHFDFAAARVAPDLADRLARRFATLLEALSFAADLPIGELPIESPPAAPELSLPADDPLLNAVCEAPVLAAAPEVISSPRLALHLACACGVEPQGIATTAPARSLPRLAAEALAARAGQAVAFDGPSDAILCRDKDQVTLLRFGPLQGDADLCGPPEYPAAFRRVCGGLVPCAGVIAQVLGPDMAPLPPGARGRLAIGGRALARGYAGDPRRTAQRFVPNALAHADDFDPASHCLFLTEHFARRDLDGRFILTSAPNAQRLGRVGHVAGAGFSAPNGPVETQLALIWAELLGQARIGRDDSFFALGGDSITAMQVSAAARAVNLDIAPMDIFRFPTLAALSEQVVPLAAAPLPKLPPMSDIDLAALEPLVCFGLDRP